MMPQVALAIALAAASGEEPLSLERAVEVALAANRDLAAARLGLDVSRAGEAVARQRPNPEFGVEASRETPHEAYLLSFPIELGGKRGRRIDASEAATASGAAEIERLTLETRIAVRRAYYEVAGAQERLAEQTELLRLAERTRDAAKDRFASGDAARFEVVQTELTAAVAETDLAAVRAALGAARSDLNVLLARPPDRATAVDDDLGAGDLPTAEAAADLALASSRDLAVIDRRLAEGEARVEAARAERVPDLVLQGGITRDSPPEFDTGWRAGASIVLPIFSQGRGEVQREESGLTQMRAERQAVEARIRASVYSAQLVAASQKERYMRYREAILPQSDDVAKLAADAYRSGQTGLGAMLFVLASVRDTRLKAIDAGLAYQTSLADLERALGAPLP